VVERAGLENRRGRCARRSVDPTDARCARLAGATGVWLPAYSDGAEFRPVKLDKRFRETPGSTTALVGFLEAIKRRFCRSMRTL
jgi:hypothetical protein